MIPEGEGYMGVTLRQTEVDLEDTGARLSRVEREVRELCEQLEREAGKANRRADRARGSEVEDVAEESVHRGYALGLKRAALLLSLITDKEVSP